MTSPESEDSARRRGWRGESPGRLTSTEGPKPSLQVPGVRSVGSPGEVEAAEGGVRGVPAGQGRGGALQGAVRVTGHHLTTIQLVDEGVGCSVSVVMTLISTSSHFSVDSHVSSTLLTCSACAMLR